MSIRDELKIILALFVVVGCLAPYAAWQMGEIDSLKRQIDDQSYTITPTMKDYERGCK